MASTKTEVEHGPLRPGELAEAAVLGDLGLVLEVIGWFVPFGGAFQALAILPFAALSSRHRLRAGVVAGLSAASVSFLVGGVGIVLQTALAATVGLSIGATYRRRWSSSLSVGVTMVVAGLPIAAVTDVVDWLSPHLRKLTFAQVRILWRDAHKVLSFLGLSGVAKTGTQSLNWVFGHWLFTIPLAELLVILVIAMICMRMRPLLSGIEKTSLRPYTGGLTERKEADRPIVPVPAALCGVSFSYPGASEPAVSDIDLEIAPGELVGVVGRNGSGKSTLVRLLAGRLQPDAGEVRRDGRAGYGEPGGTAMVFQRPESQVLGVRVRDDLRWGLPPGSRPPVTELLETVGLSGFEEAETSSLSGGQLQRLAVAAALARSPRLLISDESTAMVDREGRQEVVSLLERLRQEGIAVVHVTHRRQETEGADRLVETADGRLVAVGPPSPAAGLESPPALSGLAERRLRAGGPLVSLRQVGYVYAAKTPWAKRALSQVDLTVAAGEGLVVTGANGSGKTTLAWILGGLMVPSEGTALIGDEPIDQAPARVGVAFQHARLQLLRPVVMADLTALSSEEEARQALRDVALDPSEIAPRRVDDLSGGEQRRVALAGLLLRKPELLVLDEPYAGLDDEARYALALVLMQLRQKEHIATVVVSHDLDNAEMLGDRLLRLEAGRLVGEEPLGL